MINEKIKQVVKELKAGNLVLIMDDKDRENEGDLVCAAEFASTENVNFMATHAKGLICMPMSKKIATKLDFKPMVTNNTDNHETNFTVSIDYKDTTTGISAVERGTTARMCVKDDVKAEDFRHPGHMFPLVAKSGGVLERGGHTEAVVDLLKIAKLKECGLCCEIMREDGTMMRGKELIKFADKYKIPVITVKEIREYRKKYEMLVDKVANVNLPTKYGMFKAYCYVNKLTKKEHLALVMGDISNQDEVLCRIHSECLTGDVLGSLRCDCGNQLEEALKEIAKNKSGILLYMKQEGRGIGLVNKLKAYELQENGYDTVEANLKLGFDSDMRDYYESAQILKDLGVKKVELLTNNPDKIEQLNHYGIEVMERREIETPTNEFNEGYLLTKKSKMNHILNI
ncbi:GTP cyclohydrolase II [Ligilactobacillus salivarius]|uniref:Riboflavin biosynthesis protein RibBA n=1 Tax=Ligilactobacillus salivarius TaxID=1624 RepID=A0ABD7YVY2_9LACO|nr:GTP cyclohydrolase II [Ligilactobacillus salivarius]WHS06926.1 GTP cyclohydrolase II [Ligilactobacillus salivarius]WHS08671.1 GTP cyclohydrolase II [Ligilactobacillus salivarius]WHS10888.1 GTP cyclohydrolase II [Ligilactobacillus salivarius]WHS14826.1 GTP cyclohydrolase II [Ligilactobacillus salivarius]WHS18275.1 GTP cyclohydrolase II [Ligilactobacillus salivarius]